MKTPTPVELLIESEVNLPDLSQGTAPESFPWLKFIIVTGIVVLAFKVAYDFNVANNKFQPLKPDQNEDQ
ncbi:MAG: hypothetical protein H6582_02985 [Crocinitomicaceae bacterium]|nr:hypothetical protein [Crocinitomicaceae bacterium]